MNKEELIRMRQNLINEMEAILNESDKNPFWGKSGKASYARLDQLRLMIQSITDDLEEMSNG